MPHVEHLSKDKKTGNIILVQEKYELVKRNNVCSALLFHHEPAAQHQSGWCFSPAVPGLYKGKEPTPKQILKTPFETLRSIGSAMPKQIMYWMFCRFFIDEKITDEKLHAMSNEAVIKYLHADQRCWSGGRLRWSSCSRLAREDVNIGWSRDTTGHL